ncbi:hypothetical protein SLS60_003744 [Paraconiothyrium brasiliense]|uniref:Uncharacterized protein n=1 Tax=Paraconiothyrium brasiliense TaxID=300254 RepID=A0ABR3RR04_9PLEO
MVHGLGQKSKEEDGSNLSPNIDEEESHHDAILMKGKAPNERPTEAARIAIAGPNRAVADEEMSNSVARLKITGAVSSPNTPMHLPGQDLTLPQSPDVSRLHEITIHHSADLVDQRLVKTAVGSSKEEASSDTTSSSSFAVHGQREFLFVDAGRPKSSVQGRRNARSFVMQKARRERPWSTSKHSARSSIPPELKKPIVVLNSWGNELPLRVDDFTTMDQVYDDHVKGGTVSLHPTKDLTAEPVPSLELKETTVVDMETGQTSLIEHAPPSVGTPQAEDVEDYSKLGREAIQRTYGSRSPEQIPVKSLLPTSAERKDFDNYYIQCTCGNACVPHLLPQIPLSNEMDWKMIRSSLPEEWMWDIEYHTTHSIDGNKYGCWTCTPSEPEDPRNFPLTISLAPVVIPVEYQWPPVSGVHPPPDPWPSVLVDCANVLPSEVIRDIFLTFEGSIGFYLLINGLLQIIVPETFDREWASSHLPHRFGGLKISYINQTLEPTVTLSPSRTETVTPQGSQATQSSSKGSIFRPSRTSAASSQLLRINDFIDAKSKSSYKKERFAGRIGLKVAKHGDPSPYLVMSTHVITEAILAKSQLSEFLGRRDRFEKLDDDWNDHVEIWAGNERVSNPVSFAAKLTLHQIGTIHQTFDQEAETYPTGFKHDMTLIKPNNPSNMNDITSPIQDLGWLSRSSWHTLRQQLSSVKLLPLTDSCRPAKTIRCSTPSQVLVVGEGIFLNHKAAQPTRDQDISTWKDLVSRAVLYRVYPDFDPPTGYSGIALYAEGVREDGTEGPGVVGFQSFVQRSGHVQNFDMEGGALDKRLKLGRVAFYGAFEIPDEVKRHYRIL